MAEVLHTCPHCGHGVGRLMRVRGEGVSSCASCHKSDWSCRFPFPESDADRARREAREARREELEAIGCDSLSSDEEYANEEIVDGGGFTSAERRQQEHEGLIQRVRDEESVKVGRGRRDRVPRATGFGRVVARRRQRARLPQRPELSVRRKVNGVLVSQALLRRGSSECLTA